MIAKAETLQASIGVSCNEEDLQGAHADAAAASGREDSSLPSPSLLGSTHSDDASAARQNKSILEGQSDDAPEAALEADQAAAVEGVVEQALLDKPCR